MLLQEAAGVFAELRDVVSLRVEAPRPVDISPECANMLERLCLAQAQELTFEKFRADGKNPGILARWAPPLYLHPCKLASFKAQPTDMGALYKVPDIVSLVGGPGYHQHSICLMSSAGTLLTLHASLRPLP